MSRTCRLATLLATLALVVAAFGCGRRTESPGPKTVTLAQSPESGGDESSNHSAVAAASSESPGFAGWVERAPRETWDAIYVNDSKVGYTHTTIETTQREGETFVEIAAEHRLEVLRFGQATKQTLFISSSENEDGTFLAGAVRVTAGDANSEEVRFDRADGGLNVVKTSAQRTETDRVPFPPKSAGMYGLEESLFAKPMASGEERTVTYLMPVLNQTVVTKLVAFDVEEVDLLGGEKSKLLRIEASQDIGGTKLVTMMWTNESGEALKSYVPAINQSIYRTTKEVAAREGELAEWDLGIDSIAKAKLPAPETLNEAIFDVYVDGANAAEIFPQSGGQRVESLPGGGARIYVRRVGPESRPGAPADSVPPGEADKSANSYVQSDDPTIVEFATSKASDETDPWKIAVAMERAVHETIESKNLSRALLSAADALKLREGDCTEHAMLLAAALRARGVPAKVAIGLTYVPGFEGFAYHMWTEAWIDGKWIPLDATIAHGGTNPSYLKLADTPLDGAGPMAAFLPAVRVLGHLRVETTGVTLREDREGG